MEASEGIERQEMADRVVAGGVGRGGDLNQENLLTTECQVAAA